MNTYYASLAWAPVAAFAVGLVLGGFFVGFACGWRLMRKAWALRWYR